MQVSEAMEDAYALYQNASGHPRYPQALERQAFKAGYEAALQATPAGEGTLKTEEAKAQIIRLRQCICEIREAADNEDSDAFTQALHDAYAEVHLSALAENGLTIDTASGGDTCK